jgi:hypothetical protein
MSDRMWNKVSGFVLASHRDSPYGRGITPVPIGGGEQVRAVDDSPLRSLRSCRSSLLTILRSFEAVSGRLASDYSRAVMIVGFLFLVMLPASTFGGLFECTDASGSRVFTDRPAQLRRCMPFSVNSTPASSPAPQASAARPYQETLPMAIDPPPMPFSGQPDSAPQPIVTPEQPPTADQSCMPGYNPLNPLAAPPCFQQAQPPTAPPTDLLP